MNDKVFGELVFNNGWEKKLDCDFWGQESVKIRVSAYKDEEPNDNQRDAYSRFIHSSRQYPADLQSFLFLCITLPRHGRPTQHRK